MEGRVAVITGASSGIGAATARLFSKLGAHVVLVGRNERNLRNVAQECSAQNSKVIVQEVVADLTVEADVERLISTAIEKFSKIDILINNAGILATGSIENTSLEQYDHVMNTNVRSIYHLTMLSVPHLIHSKGAIVNVSSVNGMRAFAGVLAYCISKAAVDQFTRCLALELGPKGVRVNSVNPGVIITEIHRRGGMNDNQYEDFLNRSRSTHALGRPGTVDEVAATIAFLASTNSSFITGANIPVDGGRHTMVNIPNTEDSSEFA